MRLKEQRERDGLYEEWHENGQLSQRCFYNNGKKEGNRIVYNEDGSVFYKQFYKDGHLSEEPTLKADTPDSPKQQTTRKWHRKV